MLFALLCLARLSVLLLLRQFGPYLETGAAPGVATPAASAVSATSQR